MAGDSVAGMFKDKRMQLAAAAVGGVGLLVMVMRKGGGSSGTGQTMIQPAAGVNSSGTDLYNAVQGFRDQLSNVNDKLAQQPASGTGATVAVHGGDWLDQVAGQFGASQAQLFALNPGLNLVQANRFGFISPSNPANRDPATLKAVFAGDRQIRVS